MLPVVLDCSVDTETWVAAFPMIHRPSMVREMIGFLCSLPTELASELASLLVARIEYQDLAYARNEDVLQVPTS